MDRLAIVSDSPEAAGDIARKLSGVFETQFVRRHGAMPDKPARYALVDINLTDKSLLSELRHWLMRRPKDGKVIFAINRGARSEAVQAHAIGATDLLERPLDRKALLARLLGDKLLGDIGSLARDGCADASISDRKGIAAGVAALQSIFDAVVSGKAIELKSIQAAGETLVRDIEAGGLVHWIDLVRKHHSQTYQHCLLVSGIAVAFGRQLGFARRDQQRLAVAGLLHDLGKAEIPITVLEKPGPLDAEELAVMRRHPELGAGVLSDMPGIEPEIVDIVVHHHEYLDGSGYPHGLHARELSDLVRMITIADVYGALLERRSYKAPVPALAAYQALTNMGGKLDTDLVREFRSIALMRAG